MYYLFNKQTKWIGSQYALPFASIHALLKDSSSDAETPWLALEACILKAKDRGQGKSEDWEGFEVRDGVK